MLRPTNQSIRPFTDDELDEIGKTLPDGVSSHRLALLPSILREWASTSLPDNASTEDRVTTNHRRKKLETVEKRARDLLKAIESLDADGLFSIVRAVAATERPMVRQADLQEAKSQLAEARNFLNRLVSAVPSASWPRPDRGQPRNIPAYLVMMDIAGIFEWVTGREASRVTDRDSGQDTGDFYRFAARVWHSVFGTHKGLSAALKNWAKWRSEYGEASGLIANLAIRHRSWGIFDT